MADITNIVNTILANGSTEYQSRVPLATKTNIAEVANPILTYSGVQNEFLASLINKIAMQEIRARIWENPLAVLKKGRKPLGFDIESSHVNPATDEGFGSGADLLTKKTPDVKTEYFRLNRQGLYTVTVEEDKLRHAMQSWENLEKFTLGIVNSLYSGDYIDEFILMKNTMADAIMNQKMITAGVTAMSDEATGKSFLTALKNASSGFTYPGTSFNAYSKIVGPGPTAITTWTPKENQILVIRSDALNFLDVNVLASAFNMDKAQFLARTVEVDNFGSMSGVLGILMDDAALQVWDDKDEMRDWVNPKGLYTSYFWHHWQTYAYSVMCNAVAFVTDTTAPAAPVITAPGATDVKVTGTGEVGAIVFVTIGMETRSGTVDASGDFEVGDFTAMVLGDTVTAYQVDASGNKSPVDTEAVTA
jgi:hypothetical protein